VGPDGAIYICDWYDRQVTHTRNQEGNIDTSNGRIYRLKQKGAPPSRPFDLAKQSSTELLGLLSHENTWFRQTALRLLGDRRDASLVPALQKRLQSQAPESLEAFWALNACGGFNEASAQTLLEHPNPQVRLWTIRLLGDQRHVGPETSRAFARMAAQEPNIEVRAQLACTAKRLPASDALSIVAGLVRHRADADDSRLPLLCWWALEAQCTDAPADVLKLFEDSPFWSQPMVEQHLLERVMRRFAAAGTRKAQLACARLLELSPSREHSQRLMRGFEEAYKGRSLTGLPAPLLTAMARHNVASPALRLRQGNPEAITAALRVIADPKAARLERLQFIQILGELHPSGSADTLLNLLEHTDDAELRQATLTSLTAYDEPRIGASIAALYPKLGAAARPAAQNLLASRSAWSLALAREVEAGRIAADAVPMDAVRRMQWHKAPELAPLLTRLWPSKAAPTSQAMQHQIQHLAEVVRGGKGDPYRGQKLFNATCASCHKLYAKGGQVGPDLTSYQRSDLDAMLLNIVNPSAEIREGFESFIIETKDDRTLSGFLVERDAQLLVLRGVDGQNVTLEPKDVVEMRPGSLSLMPEGLLDPLSDEQVRDLFAYLRTTQPLAN
jgi:putative heme-binding domain-containing protein